MRKYYIIGLLVLFAGIGLFLIKDFTVVKAETPKDLGIPIQIEKVVSGGIREEMNYLGNIKSNNQLFLAFKQPGFITKLQVKEGDVFQKGDLLGQLDNDEILLKKAMAEQKRIGVHLNVTHLEDLLTKNSILYEAGAVTKQQLDDLTLQYEMAKSSLLEVDLQIREIDLLVDRSNIYAPYDGLVREILKKEGEFIQPGQPLLNISEKDDLVIEVAMIEKDLSQINLGDRVFIHLKSGEILESKINKIANTLNPQTKTGSIEIPIIDLSKNLLLPNMSIKISIIKDEKQDTLLISDKAVVNKNGSDFVYCYENGMALEKEIKLGLKNGKLLEVVDGLTQGESIIVSNLYEITNNTKVFVYKGVEAD